MKRVEIDYLGKPYSLPNTTAEHVRTEIKNGLEKNKPFWLRVNSGEGKPQAVDLLITPGVGINVQGGSVDRTNHTISEHNHEELE